jgi:hypothetical protein
MRGAPRPATAGEDCKLDAAERQAAADFLRLAHDASELWRRCARKPCRRMRTCAGELDDCGARAFPEGWAWVRGLFRSLRDGRAPGAAGRAADRRVVALENDGAFGRKRPRTVILRYRGGLSPIRMVVND